jgi:hypothetical protein
VGIYEGKVTDYVSNHRTLIGSDNRNGVIRDAGLEERNDPNDGNEEESNDRSYLKFDVIAQLKEAKG